LEQVLLVLEVLVLRQLVLEFQQLVLGLKSLEQLQEQALMRQRYRQ
jgi:hypothetical protein